MEESRYEQRNQVKLEANNAVLRTLMISNDFQTKPNNYGKQRPTKTSSIGWNSQYALGIFIFCSKFWVKKERAEALS